MSADQEVRLAVLETRLKEYRRAVKLQALEYERRLAELNHAHDKQVADQSTYISDDRFTGWQGEVNSWRGVVTAKLAELEGRSGGKNAVQDTIFKILPMVIAVGAVAALVWKS